MSEDEWDEISGSSDVALRCLNFVLAETAAPDVAATGTEMSDLLVGLTARGILAAKGGSRGVGEGEGMGEFCTSWDGDATDPTCACFLVDIGEDCLLREGAAGEGDLCPTATRIGSNCEDGEDGSCCSRLRKRRVLAFSAAASLTGLYIGSSW